MQSDEEEWAEEFKPSSHNAGRPALSWKLVVHVTPGIGDRVLLPSHCLEQLSVQANGSQNGPMTFRLSSMKRRTHCGVREFTSEEGTIVLSESLAHSLRAEPLETISVFSCSLPRATSCVLQPLHAHFFGIPDHKAALESLLRQHRVTLTTGDCITMPWAGTNSLKRTSSTGQVAERAAVYELGVVSLKPAGAVCIIDCDMEVEIEPLEGEGGLERHEMVAVGAAGLLGEVEAEEYAYYEVPIDETLECVVLQLEVDQGDADLFCSCTDRFPSRSNHVWRGVDVGRVELTISKHDPRLVWETTPLVYLAVRGYAPHTKYTLQATRTASLTPGLENSKPQQKRKRVALASNQPPLPGMARCEHCHQDISESAMVLHAAQCAQHNWVCPICRSVLGMEDKNLHFHCPECPLLFGSQGSLDKHLVMLHQPLECQCGASATMDHMGHHRRTECSLRQVTCRFCASCFEAGAVAADHKDRLNGLTAHESVCGSRTE
eukprot:TRINITY_DN5354_c0_g2_i5.p1 TRINITY_DN5354_c0_g2~~TRINITY_DN5354_c0_g2_i5.p1  ORF type:complete len:491 (+),score=77.88 TRINITY_DN5354_c0_g2_i5:182-1654(+)